MAIESIAALVLGTAFLVGFSLFASSHRSEDTRCKKNSEHKNRS